MDYLYDSTYGQAKVNFEIEELIQHILYKLKTRRFTREHEGMNISLEEYI